MRKIYTKSTHAVTSRFSGESVSCLRAVRANGAAIGSNPVCGALAVI